MWCGVVWCMHVPVSGMQSVCVKCVLAVCEMGMGKVCVKCVKCVSGVCGVYMSGVWL